MKLMRGVALATLAFGGAMICRATSAAVPDVASDAQRVVLERYLTGLRAQRYDDVYALLNSDAQAYYHTASNLQGVYGADRYRVTAYRVIAARGDRRLGRVFFVRETARFRDHAHDVDLTVTATVPIGVVAQRGAWRIKDPGHPWSAFATHAHATANGVRVTVKKLSFFARRIEAVVTFVNTGPAFVTVLPYGKSLLRSAAGTPYRTIETRDWSLTDKTLFEGLRLAPNAQYTGIIAFACERLAGAPAGLSLSVGPMLVDGSNAPFTIDVGPIDADARPVDAHD